MSKKSARNLLIVLTILILPSLFYLFLTRGKNNYNSIEIYGPRDYDSQSGDTIYHTIPEFSFVNFDSSVVNLETFKDKFFVTDFFFATCPTICPKMNSHMGKVQYEFKDDDDVMLLSHTVNPEADSVPVLSEYAKKYGAKPGKWFIVTGYKPEIYDLARQGYFISATEGNGGPNDFVHSEMLVLVDKNKHIRGYYEGTNLMEINRLIDDINLLKYEEKKK